MPDMMREIYFFDMATKEYLHAGTIEPTSTGGLAIPADATLTPPPDPSEIPPNTTPIWDHKGHEWQLVPDYRNVPVYSTETKDKIVLKLGEVPDPVTTTLLEPTNPHAEWNAESQTWVLPLDVLKEIKKEEIKRAFLRSEDAPCHTGVVGIAVKKNEIEDTEELEVVVKSNLTSRDHIQLLIDIPPVSKEGSEEADNLVVVRDYNNRYVQVTRKQLADILKAQKAAAVGNLYRKWMLQERINDAQTREEVEATTWDMDWSDVDAKGV